MASCLGLFRAEPRLISIGLDFLWHVVDCSCVFPLVAIATLTGQKRSFSFPAVVFCLVVGWVAMEYVILTFVLKVEEVEFAIRISLSAILAIWNVLCLYTLRLAGLRIYNPYIHASDVT